MCVEADDGETLDDVAQLLHVLLVDITLLGAILPNEEELAESRQEFLRQSLQLRSGLSPARQSGGDQQLPGGDDLRQTLVQSPPLEIRSRQPSRQAFQGALDLDYEVKTQTKKESQTPSGPLWFMVSVLNTFINHNTNLLLHKHNIRKYTSITSVYSPPTS